MEKRMRRRIRKTMIMVAAMSALLVVPAAPASASTSYLTGLGTPVEECGGQTSMFTLEITGDLEGCIYTTHYVGRFVDGLWTEKGTEHALLCLDIDGEETCGTFDTTYRFFAEFDDAGEQIAGGCVHPIVAGSGTDGFEGVTGRLQFVDDLEAGNAAYRATVTLP